MSAVWEAAPHPDATAAEAPGGFREHDIRPFGGGMRPIPWPSIVAELTSWFDDASALATLNLAPTELPLRLARLHATLERIHPFLDWNGRAGRLALNLVFVRLGYPPAIILKRERTKYRDALDQPTGRRWSPGRADRALGHRQSASLRRPVTSPARPGWFR